MSGQLPMGALAGRTSGLIKNGAVIKSVNGMSNAEVASLLAAGTYPIPKDHEAYEALCDPESGATYRFAFWGESACACVCLGCVECVGCVVNGGGRCF